MTNSPPLPGRAGNPADAEQLPSQAAGRLLDRIPDGFTTGPWKIDQDHHDGPSYWQISTKSLRWGWLARVVVMLNGGRSLEGEDNARLIALAPELATALRDAHARIAELEDEVENCSIIINERGSEIIRLLKDRRS
jgi:hypothetical protein